MCAGFTREQSVRDYCTQNGNTEHTEERTGITIKRTFPSNKTTCNHLDLTKQRNKLKKDRQHCTLSPHCFPAQDAASKNAISRSCSQPSSSSSRRGTLLFTLVPRNLNLSMKRSVIIPAKLKFQDLHLALLYKSLVKLLIVYQLFQLVWVLDTGLFKLMSRYNRPATSLISTWIFLPHTYLSVN